MRRSGSRPCEILAQIAGGHVVRGVEHSAHRRHDVGRGGRIVGVEDKGEVVGATLVPVDVAVHHRGERPAVPPDVAGAKPEPPELRRPCGHHHLVAEVQVGRPPRSRQIARITLHGGERRRWPGQTATVRRVVTRPVQVYASHTDPPARSRTAAATTTDCWLASPIETSSSTRLSRGSRSALRTLVRPRLSISRRERRRPASLPSVKAGAAARFRST